MTTIRSTDKKAAMLRSVVARHKQGYEWVPADDLLNEGRPYDRARALVALVYAGMLQRRDGGGVYIYKATPAGTEWVARDQNRDSLGRRRGGPRPVIGDEVINRARELLREPDEHGKRRSLSEVARMIGINRTTLGEKLYPERHKRRLERRRKSYQAKER